MTKLPLLFKGPLHLKDELRYVFVSHAFALRVEIEFVITGISKLNTNALHINESTYRASFECSSCIFSRYASVSAAFLSVLFCEINNSLRKPGHPIHSLERQALTFGPYRRNQLLEVCFEDVEVLFRCPFWIKCRCWLQTIARLRPVQGYYKKESANSTATASAQRT
jgi:hypothetical protein